MTDSLNTRLIDRKIAAREAGDHAAVVQFTIQQERLLMAQLFLNHAQKIVRDTEEAAEAQLRYLRDHAKEKVTQQ